MNNIKELPNVASFLVTENCNLRCTYCFEKHNTAIMSKEVAERGVEFICENAINNKLDHFGVMLFGGEPCLHPEILEVILDKGLELSKKFNIKFNGSMVTNATILNSEVERVIRRYIDELDNFTIQLSVDGIPEVHDHYRVTVDGGPSYHMIEKNLPIWKDMFKDNPDALTIHGCSNKETLPYLFENYKFFREDLDMSRIWFIPIHSEEWDFNDVQIYEEELNKIAEYILTIINDEDDINEIWNYAPIDRCMNPEIFADAPCGAGKSFITITANGELYPCHQIYFNDPEKITKTGDIWNGIDHDRNRLFAEYDRNDLSCNVLNPDCDATNCYICLGDNWLRNGSILSSVDVNKSRCLMSHVEKRVQRKVKRELEKMGLFNNNNNNNCNCGNYHEDDCLCNVRANTGNNYHEDDCGCGNGGTCNCDEISEVDDALMQSSLAILETLDKLVDSLNSGKEGDE